MLRRRSAVTALTLALGLLGGGTSCRLGNYVESSAATTTGPSGYYKTSPQALYFCAVAGTTQCAAAPVNRIPSTVSGVMTNPIAFVTDEDDPTGAYLAASDGSGRALPVSYDAKTAALSFIGSTARSVLWIDSACTTQLFVDESGSYTRKSGMESILGKPISGTLNVTILLTRVFEGDCSASLTAMKECYENSDNCGGASASENAALQADVAEMVDPYIQAGVLTSAGIPSLTTVSYQSTYE